jgi:hypothetical protein
MARRRRMRKPGKRLELLIRIFTHESSKRYESLFGLGYHMNYEEFLQLPFKFLEDFERLLEIKKKWKLPLTGDEKMLRRHILRYRLQSALKLPT